MRSLLNPHLNADTLHSGPLGMPVCCLATPVEDPDRMAHTRAHFADMGLGGFWGVNYLVGLHKSTSGLTTDHLYMVDRPAPDAEPYSMGKHPVNIWLGHYFAWQALKLSGDSHWLIVECDTKMASDWYVRFGQALKDVPEDFDFLYIGSCCTGQYDRDHIAGDIYQLHGIAPQCNHGYVLAAKAVPVLETTLRAVWAPIDIQQASETFTYGYPLPRCVPAAEPPRRLTTYAVLPRIFDQFNTELPL